MSQLVYLIKKELLLLSRDPHGLLLLFVMPCVFILIMTFALQNQYAVNDDTRLDFYLVNQDGDAASGEFSDLLSAMSTFNRIQSALPPERLRQETGGDRVKFLVIVPENFKKNLTGQLPAVEIEFAPSTSAMFAGVIESQVASLLNRLYLQHRFGSSLAAMGVPVSFDSEVRLVQTSSLYSGETETPSSVQQNVPAWLLFAMFFIAVPLSTTLINERQQGTLSRLQTMGVSPVLMLAGKLMPYLVVNLIQVVLLFLVGLYLVPVLGGDQLTLGAHPAGLLVISAAASLAAVSWALLIAQLTSTVEQATIFSAVANIIMAAVGGVMVPRFIMPESMQQLSELSPMAWGLDGFLDILLRNGTVADVLPEAGRLLAFACIALILAVILTGRSSQGSRRAG